VKRALIFLVVIALGLATLAYFTTHRNGGAKDDEYKTALIEYGDMRDVISGMASIRPFDAKPVFSMISGQVVELNATFNDVVEEGEILIQLDPSEAQTKVTGAQKQLRTAQENVDWAKAKQSQAKKGLDAAKLVRDAVMTSTSSGEVDRARAKAAAILADGAVDDATGAVKTAEAKLAEAEALVAQANLGLKYTTIKVPSFQFAEGKPHQPALGKVQLDGENQRPKRKFKVLERKVELGQNIDAKQILFTLVADLEHMQAHAFIPESRIDRVAKDQKAVFWVDALGEDDKMPAVVTEIHDNPVQQQGAIFFEVLLDIKNRQNPKTRQWQLKPGMTAPQLEITDRIHQNVWKLPVNALSFSLDEGQLSPEAKKRADDMESKLDMNEWTRIWILKDKKPQAAFVRLKGLNAAGETGIKDAEYHEILEWDPDTKATLDPKNPPEVIIGAPVIEKGLFRFKNIKFNL
jgi:HlyD family secretion protein